MREQKRERFKELCEHAEVVDDPVKLAKIASQIGRILESEVDELKKHQLRTLLEIPHNRRARLLHEWRRPLCSSTRRLTFAVGPRL